MSSFVLSCVQLAKRYRALDKDVALLNVYFGEATVMGRWQGGREEEKISTEYERDLKRTTPEILVDMASWAGHNKHRMFLNCPCSLLKWSWAM